MAPEVVSERMNVTDFDAFKYADVYSFGLVLWEICRRTKSGDKEEVKFYVVWEFYTLFLSTNHFASFSMAAGVGCNAVL
jgi:hypothetical protein